MASKNLHLTYALKDGKITPVSEVERGLKCGCVCPACGEKLVARKGRQVMHHFAHYATQNCEYGYESSLHLAAKEILSQVKRMVIPPVYLRFPNSWKGSFLLCDAKEIAFDRVELEKRFDSVVPDVVVYAGEKFLFIEIFVTHCVDKAKLDKLRAANISTIEIDLRKIDESVKTEELTALLVGNSEYKYWKYNAFADKYLRKFYQAADKRSITSGRFVYECPIATRTLYGVPCTNVKDDCRRCRYCICHSFEGGILCSGRQRIATIQDLNIYVGR